MGGDVVNQLKKRRPGTIYVACEHCKKEISHSNIAAHVRKAHPEFAKLKKERARKVLNSNNLSVAAAGEPLTGSRGITGNGRMYPNPTGPRSTCMHCHMEFSRGHLSKHIKKQHPVEAVIESMVKKVVFEGEFLHPSNTSSSSRTGLSSSRKRPAPSSSPVASEELEAHSGVDRSIFASTPTAVASCSDVSESGGSVDHDAEKCEGGVEKKARKRRDSATAVCKYCSVTITKKHMVVHIRKLHPEMLYIRKENEVGSDTKSLAVNSNISHDHIASLKCTKEKSENPSLATVACKYCGKEITKKSIRAHVRNIHPDEEGGRDKVKEGDCRGTVGKHPIGCPTTECKYCGKTITKKSIRAHVRNLHPEAALGEVLSAAAAAAATSGMGSAAPSIYKPNMLSVGKIDNQGKLRMETVTCPHCQLQVPYTELSNHVRSAHERTQTSLCKYCPKQIQNRNMNTHVRKYHIVESVVELLVGQVVSLNETPPAVLDLGLPESRFLTPNELSSSSPNSSSIPFSTQRELDKYDALRRMEEKKEQLIMGGASAAAVAAARKNKKDVVTASSTGNKKRKAEPNNSGVSSKTIVADSNAARKRKKLLQQQDNKKHKKQSSSPALLQQPPATSVQQADADYTNLNLLATFAASLQPISI